MPEENKPQRVKAVIAYDGSAFSGFQKQKSTDMTVTTAIEKALASLQIDADIVGSGRTDAGVHATGQVIHFDLPPFWRDLKKLKISLNRKLDAIRVKHITAVDQHFHARFSAKKRRYRYVFKTTDVSLFERKYISAYSAFEAQKLKEALKHFEGEHDFRCFLKTGTLTHTTRRHIFRTAYLQRGNYHYIYFEANGFLRSQVRMMVEAAMRYARGELSLAALEEQLEGKQKHVTSLAPPEGLYLARVTY